MTVSPVWLQSLRTKNREELSDELAWRRKIGHDEHANIISRAIYRISNITHDNHHACGAQVAVIENNTSICLGCGERSKHEHTSAE
jgi:hypothetical protein